MRNLPFEAPPAVRDRIASIERGEDLTFSPDGRCLALADFLSGAIVVIRIELFDSSEGPSVLLSQAVRLTSLELIDPHGLTYLDDDHLAVGNRSGDLVVYRLGEEVNGLPGGLIPLRVFPAGEGLMLHGPGSLASRALGGRQFELLVCNNWTDSVHRLVLDSKDGFSPVEEGVLLRRWIDLPDGIAMGPGGRWLATSCHLSQSVLLHEASELISPDGDPQGVLRGAAYPHGVRFTSDGRFALVADAGAPYVHIYHRDDGDWGGIHDPVLTLQTMDESLFRRGQLNPQEGGPKGLAIDPSGLIVATCCQFQPLAFFDFGRIAASAAGATSVQEIAAETQDRRGLHALHVRLEIERQQRHVDRAHEIEDLRALQSRSSRSAQEGAQRLETMLRSRSWRFTAPLRWTSRRLRPIRDASR